MRLKASINQINAQFEDLLSKAAYSGERIILEGKNSSAVLVPIEDLELLEEFENYGSEI